MVQIERHRAGRAEPMQQEHHFTLLGGCALPSSKDYLPHMEDHLWIQLVLRVKGLTTRVTHEVVSRYQRLSGRRACKQARCHEKAE